MWLPYSGNFAPDRNGQKIQENPPGIYYGMVFQKIQLLNSFNVLSYFNSERALTSRSSSSVVV